MKIKQCFSALVFHSIAAQKAILFANSLNPLASALSIGVFPTQNIVIVSIWKLYGHGGVEVVVVVVAVVVVVVVEK